MQKSNGLIVIFTALIFQSSIYASESTPTPAEMEAWFNDDTEFLIADVNEGKLSFLPDLKNKPTHKAQANNQIKILATSAKDGWVEMSQCHRGLDAMPLVQLIFPEYTLRNLKITKQKGIAEAVVEAKSIQMADVSHGAELCVAMQIKALKKNAQGQYVLSNGPYQRRFLDGYYPMKLELDVDYSQSGLEPIATMPMQQPGFEISDSKQQMKLNAHFEGVLRTQISFVSAEKI